MAEKNEKRGPGQPPLPDDMKRTNFAVRLNAKERAKIERLAKKAGLPVATYVRKKALEEI